MLSAADQERFSRHLLLDGLGGKGQERICAGSVEIALPDSFSRVAKACARSLAAAGVGQLTLCGSWAEDVAQECAALSSSTKLICGDCGEPAATVLISADGGPAAANGIVLEKEAPRSAADAAALGALAALEAIKRLAKTGSPARQPLAAFAF